MLSITISTYNRQYLLKNSLQSFKNSSFNNYEIIVIDQSQNNLSQFITKSLNFNSINIRYFKIKRRNLSYARSLGVKLSKGNIVAFTDDDCIVSKNWLKNIVQTFKKNQDIVGVFGKVLPYKPQLKKGKICPCTFLNNQKRIISKPCLHSKNIGFGNNMAFRREIFEKVGRFKEWLGPGSIGSNAEDAEFALRILSKGYKILYNPKIKAYHNRWLTKEEFRKQQLSYACGEVACYGFFAFQGKKFAKRVMVNNFKDSYEKFRKSLELIFSLKKYGLLLFIHTLEEFYFRLRGLMISFYFSKREPL